MCDIDAAMNDLRRGREMFRDMRRSLRPRPDISFPPSTMPNLARSPRKHSRVKMRFDRDYQASNSLSDQVEELRSQLHHLKSQNLRQWRRKKRSTSSSCFEERSQVSTPRASEVYGADLLGKVAQLEEVIRSKDGEVRRKSQQVKDTSEHLLTKIQALSEETKQLRAHHDEKARELEQTKSQVCALQTELLQNVGKKSEAGYEVHPPMHQRPPARASTNQEDWQPEHSSGSIHVHLDKNKNDRKHYHIAAELERIHSKVMKSEDRMHELQTKHKAMLRKLEDTVSGIKSLETENARVAGDARAKREVLEERNRLATEALNAEYQNLLQAKSQKWKQSTHDKEKYSMKEVEQLRSKVAAYTQRVDASKKQLEQLVILSSTQEAAEHQELGQYSTSLAKASASAAQCQKALTDAKSRNCSHRERLSDMQALVLKREEHLQTVEFETDHAIEHVGRLESRLRSHKLKHTDSILTKKQQLEAKKRKSVGRTRFLKAKVNEHVAETSLLQDQMESFSNQLERLRMEDSNLVSRYKDLRMEEASQARRESTGDKHDCGRVKELVEQIETCQAELRHMNDRIDRAQQQRVSAEAALCLSSQEGRSIEISLESRLASNAAPGHSTFQLKQSLLHAKAELAKAMQELDRKQAQKRSLLTTKSQVEVQLHSEVGRARDVEREVVMHNARLREGLKRERRQLDANNHESAVAWAKLEQALNPPG